jgi:hypothetical protein
MAPRIDVAPSADRRRNEPDYKSVERRVSLVVGIVPPPALAATRPTDVDAYRWYVLLISVRR